MGITVRSTGDKNDSQHIVGHDYSTTAPILVPAVNKNFRRYYQNMITIIIRIFRPTTTYTKTIYSSPSSISSSMPSSSKTFASSSSSPARSSSTAAQLPPPMLLNGGTNIRSSSAAAVQSCDVDMTTPVVEHHESTHSTSAESMNECVTAVDTAR